MKFRDEGSRCRYGLGAIHDLGFELSPESLLGLVFFVTRYSDDAGRHCLVGFLNHPIVQFTLAMRQSQIDLARAKGGTAVTDAERKAQEQNTRPTDLAPSSRQPSESHTVKIELRDGNTHAHIRSKDGKVDMFVPAGLLYKRFRQSSGTVSGYFKCLIKGGIGVLEVGERVDLPPEKQW